MKRDARVPGATYRVQLNARFPFERVRGILSYLDALGITDLYCSPIVAARRGSTHGYDVTDPSRVNPELGDLGAFDLLAGDLRRRGMGLLLDVVPNHMAADQENPWWADLLEKGPRSACAGWFDIDWSRAFESRGGKVVLPVLGDEYDAVLDRGELSLVFDENGFAVRYHDRRFPIDPATWLLVVGACPAGTPRVALERIAVQAARPGSDTARLKRALWRLYREDAPVRAAVATALRRHTGDRLDDLLGRQNYRLVLWRRAASEINYRRFFNITDLVCLKIEDPLVFGKRHALLLRLVSRGGVGGVRVDHVDGLADPAGYLGRLRRRLGPGAWLLVEKILGSGEEIPDDWPVAGTTGYEFLNQVTALQIDPRGAALMRRRAGQAMGGDVSFARLAHDCRVRIARRHFIGEMRDLASRLHALAPADGDAAMISQGALCAAIIELTAAMPVYRTYIRGGRCSRADREIIRGALRRARPQGRSLGRETWGLLEKALLPPASARRRGAREKARIEFVSRWQQFSGPIMAKGVEDTALYAWPGLLSLNEVGSDPDAKGLTVEAFHREMMRRGRSRPRAMSTTATHDTKRGEDMRARISVLSEIPAEWEAALGRWRSENHGAGTLLRGAPVPGPEEELFVYQTLVGSWPVDGRGLRAYRGRLRACLVKSAREAKRHTSWFAPDVAHEKALLRFVDRILDEPRHGRFRRSFRALLDRIGPPGAVNGLAQVVLRNAAPGVPDLYQGCELWDQSMVDPDNRRPVDFERRRRLLESLQARDRRGTRRLAADLLARWSDGRVKLFVVWKSLAVRRSRPDLFARGRYLPFRVEGPARNHLCAFARTLGDNWVLAVVPLRTASLAPPGRFPLGRATWAGTRIIVPRGAPDQWLDTLGGATVRVAGRRGRRVLEAAALLDTLPVALLKGRRG